MEARKIISESIKQITKEEIRPRLKEIIDIIDGYGLIKVLTDDNVKDISQDYMTHDIAGFKVQTVIGQNYRVNLFENDSVEVTFSIRNTTHDKIEEYKAKLEELRFKNRTSYKASGSWLSLKSTVTIPQNVDSEDIVKIFELFDIK